MTTTAHAAAQPTTSFVVTCHNLGQYLDDAVSCILALTVRDLEIVVVNDGSTDALTCRVLADYARDRTRVVHGVRRGLPGAPGWARRRIRLRSSSARSARERPAIRRVTSSVTRALRSAGAMVPVAGAPTSSASTRRR